MMVSENVTAETTAGLVVIALSFLSQVVGLMLMRILYKLHCGGISVVLRMWLYLASSLDEISFFIFHFKYHVFPKNYDDHTVCTVLRFLSACSSTFTMMWLFVITVYYFFMTINPSKCFSFHARFLSHCVSFTWTFTSGLMYLLMAFFLRRKQHQSYILPCWDDVTHTIHLYLTYGNELIVFAFVVPLIVVARIRISCKREQIQFFSQRRELKLEILDLKHNVNTLLLLIVLMCLYYTFLALRFMYEPSGSDLSIMVIHSLKGIFIVATTCYLDRNVIHLLKCRLDLKARENNHIPGRVTDSERPTEMNTFVFD